MSSIPYNYGKYINDKVSLRDQGHVSASKQIQSPASAGSRGLAKTTQFTNDRTQMQMGNSPIAESMVEIRNILNRIDGVNAPVQEKEFNANDERDEAPREGDVVNHKDLGKVSVVKVTGSDQMGQPAEYMVQAKLSYDELMGDVELGKFESAVQ